MGVTSRSRHPGRPVWLGGAIMAFLLFLLGAFFPPPLGAQ